MATPTGAVVAAPRTWLRVEGLLALILSVLLYAHLGSGWGLFALLFLAPDLFMLGYFTGPRAGAAAYNVAHSYVTPAVFAVASTLVGWAGVPIALIWCAHIGFDRVLGYGLKYPTAFGDTHLGLVGRQKEPA